MKKEREPQNTKFVNSMSKNTKTKILEKPILLNSSREKHRSATGQGSDALDPSIVLIAPVSDMLVKYSNMYIVEKHSVKTMR